MVPISTRIQYEFGCRDPQQGMASNMHRCTVLVTHIDRAPSSQRLLTKGNASRRDGCWPSPGAAVRLPCNTQTFVSHHRPMQHNHLIYLPTASTAATLVSGYCVSHNGCSLMFRSRCLTGTGNVCARDGNGLFQVVV